MRRHPWIAVLLGVLVSGVLLAFALHRVNGADLKHALANADYYLVLPFLVILFVFYALKAQRWADLLSPMTRCGAAKVFPAVMIGYAGNSIARTRSSGSCAA